jgi:hypothetical protein
MLADSFSNAIDPEHDLLDASSPGTVGSANNTKGRVPSRNRRGKRGRSVHKP